MTVTIIVEWAKWICIFILGAAVAYYRASSVAQAFVANLIVQAEKLYTEAKAGGEKFNWVCDHIYALVPAALHPVITHAMVEKLVQSTFDAMAQYAQTQLDKLLAKKD